MMNNPLELLKLINNPKQYAMNYVKQVNNPVISNMVQLAQEGKTQEVERIARNYLKEQGIDYDKQVMPLFNRK